MEFPSDSTATATMITTTTATASARAPFSVQLFAELTSELTDLAETIARTALHVKINDVITDGGEVDRAAEALRLITTCTTESAVQAELMPSSAAIKCDVPAVDMVRTANFALSLRPDSCASNASRGAIDLIDELSEAAFVESKDASCVDNTIAAHVLVLHDRLGGFIKPA